MKFPQIRAYWQLDQLEYRHHIKVKKRSQFGESSSFWSSLAVSAVKKLSSTKTPQAQSSTWRVLSPASYKLNHLKIGLLDVFTNSRKPDRWWYSIVLVRITDQFIIICRCWRIFSLYIYICYKILQELVTTNGWLLLWFSTTSAESALLFYHELIAWAAWIHHATVPRRT